MKNPNDPITNQTRDLPACAAHQPTAPARVLHLQGRGSSAGCSHAHTPTWAWAKTSMLLGLEGTETGFDVFNLFLSYNITKTSTEERNEKIRSTHYSTGNFRGTSFCTNFQTLTASLYDMWETKSSFESVWIVRSPLLLSDFIP